MSIREESEKSEREFQELLRSFSEWNNAVRQLTTDADAMPPGLQEKKAAIETTLSEATTVSPNTTVLCSL